MRSSKLADETRLADGLAKNVNPVTVLVIDDSKMMRRSAAEMLRQAGYLAITAADGFEALHMLADQRPDLIFLDIAMPRLDGYQTCALIKHHKVFRHIPVVMLSSEDAVFDRAHGRVVGAEHCINKPFSQDDLLRAIERYANSTADCEEA